MEITESGIVTEVKELQSENAESPIEITESGIVIEVKYLQPENAECLTDLMEFPRLTDFRLLHS